jgi:hypothetical protein
LFFLDPTRPGVDQINSIAKLGDILRRIRRTPLKQPVAVCVPKLDLVQRDDVALLSPEVKAICSQLNVMHNTREPASWDFMERNSELTAQLCQAIWPVWHIHRELKSVFGTNLRFFPITMAGTHDRQETAPELSEAMPLGVLAPYLWLLHALGYPTLK